MRTGGRQIEHRQVCNCLPLKFSALLLPFALHHLRQSPHQQIEKAAYEQTGQTGKHRPKAGVALKRLYQA